MLPGNLKTGNVIRYVTRVVVNNVERAAESVTLSSALRGDLPSQIRTSSGSMTREGSIRWTTDKTIQDRPVTVYRDYGIWRPQKGDTVVIYQGDGVSEWPRFTGVIDETTGSVGAGMESTIVADIDSLSETFQVEALLSRLHPHINESTSIYRPVGLSPMYFVEEAFRSGLRYVTPPTIVNSIANIPLQGTLLPTIDSSTTVWRSQTFTGNQLYPLIHEAPWGATTSDFNATYLPGWTRRTTDPLQISLMIGEDHSEPGSVTINYGSNVYVRLTVGTLRDANIYVSVDGSSTLVCRLPAGSMNGATRVEAVIDEGSAEIQANNGEWAAADTPATGNHELTDIRVIARPGSRFAGLQVSSPAVWQRFSTLYFEPSAVLYINPYIRTTWGPITASPRYNSRSAVSMLESLADETLSAMWVDEEGVIHFMPSTSLRIKRPVKTITTSDDVLALSWSDRLLAVGSRVTIAYKHPLLSISGHQSVEVARGRRNSIVQGDVVEDIYSPSGNEDWYGVDTEPRRLPVSTWAEYNSPSGSFTGVTYLKDGEPVSNTSGNNVRITVAREGITDYRVTHEGVSIRSNEVAETMVHPEWPGLYSINESAPLPVLRAWGKVEWVERESTAITGLTGPHIRVDLGEMCASSRAPVVRDYLIGKLEEAIPNITDLDVVPDPRLQLSDVITLESPSFLGVDITAQVTGIRETMSAQGATQSLDLEVTNVAVGDLTWHEWEQAFPGTLTYDQWRTRRDDTDTYDNFNADPLKGAN